MTSSRIAGSAANGLPKLFSFLLLAALPLGAATPHPPQQRSVVGQWRGVDRGATVTMVIHPNGQYVQHAQSGTLVTRESGQFKLVGSNRIAFSAANSLARTPQIGHATEAGSYSATQRTGMPLGPANTIVFTSPRRIVFTNETTHHSITMTRVP